MKGVSLFNELKIGNEDLNLLINLIQTVNKSIDLEEIYRVALDSVIELENVDVVMIYLVEEEKREAVLQAHRNIPEDYIKRAGRIPYPRGLTWKLINSGKSLNIEDIQKNPDIGAAGRELGHRSALGIPINLEERIIGCIWFGSYGEERMFDEREVGLLSTLGDYIAIAVARAKMFGAIKQQEVVLRHSLDQLYKKNCYETIIRTVTQSVHQSINLQEVLENAVEAMNKNIDRADSVSIYLVEGEEAVLKAYRGYPEWFIKRIGRIPYPKDFTWRTIIEEKLRYCEDVDKDTVVGRVGREIGTKSYLSMPIRLGLKTVGVINIVSLQKNAFDEEELKLLEIVAQQIEVAFNNARQTELLQESKERYRALYEDNPSMYFTVDAHGKIISVNEYGAERLGYRVEELIGQSVLNVFYENDRKAVLEQLRMCLQSPGQIFQWELRKVRKDWSILWVIETTRAVRRTDGHTVVLIACEDVTERKLAEDALKESFAQLSRKNRYETIIHVVTRSVHRSVSLQDVFENAVEAMSTNIDRVDSVAIYLVEGDEAVMKAGRGYTDRYIERAGRIPYPKGLTWKVIMEEKPRYCADVDEDTVIGPAGKELGTKSYLSMPIYFEDKTVGCINIGSFQENAFDDEELKLLEILARQIEIAINNAQQAETLRQSEERYRILFDQSPVGVYIFDKEFKIKKCNERFVQILQSSYDKIIGLDMRKLRNQCVPPLMEKVFEGQSAVWEGLYEATNSVVKLWVSIRLSPLRDANGSVIGGMAVVEDITERKRAEEIIKESEARYRAIVEDQTELICRFLPDGTLTFVNETYCRYFAKKREELIGRNFISLIPDDDKELAEEYLASISQENTVGTIEHRIIKPGGEIRWQQWTDRAIFDEGGQLVEFQSVGRDITNRKQAEGALRDSEEKYRTLVEHSYDLIIETNIDSRFLYVSSRHKDALGYEPDELLGKSIFEHVHPNDRQAVMAEFQRATITRSSGHAVFRFRHKNGQWRWLESTGKTFTTVSGELRGLIVSRDITERTQAEQALQKAHDELEIGVQERTVELIEANKVLQAEIAERKRAEGELKVSREQLRALAAHIQLIREEERAHIAREIHDELGQLLTGIKMDLSWLEKKFSELVDMAHPSPLHDKVNRMSDLVDSTIKEVRRIASELRPGVLDDLGLVAAIEWQAQDFQKRTGIQCYFTFNVENTALDRDRSTAMFRILQETLTNVVRHSNATGVNIRFKEHKDQILLEVEDNGRGITESEISDPKSLGLLGMRERTLLFSGEINITGRLGEGTKVTVIIPLERK